MGRKSWIAVAVSLTMLTVLFNVAGPAGSEMITSGHCLGGYGNDVATSVEIDSAGNVYIAGRYMELANSSTRGFVAKFAPDGSLAWNLGLQHQSYSTGIMDIALDVDGSVYLLVTSSTAILAKVSSSGTLVFAEDIHSIGVPERIAYNPATGGVIVVGDMYGYGEGVIASFSSTGSELWAKSYVGSETASPWGVAVDPSGNILMVLDRMLPANVGVVQFSPQGDLLRQAVLSTELVPEYSWDIVTDLSGNVYVLGLELDGYNVLVSRLTPTLEQVWSEYLVTQNSWQECLRLAVAGDGSVYAVGYGYIDNSSVFSAVSLHIASDGSLVESSAYTSSDISWLDFYDAAFNAAGSIVFAGACYGQPTLISTPIPGVTPDPTAGTWTSDYLTWSDFLVSPNPTIVDSNTPSVYVDDYSTSMAAQAWFGRVRVPELQTSIEYRVSGQEGRDFTFRGSVTGGERPYTFSWDFGDGSMGSGKRTTHTYSGPGMYAVGLTVTDGTGKFGYSMVTVSVSGPPVIITVYYADPALTNSSETFRADAYDVDGGLITAYSWDFGDGTSTVTIEYYVDHVYTSAGYYTLTLVVTDDEGDTASYQTSVNVIDVPNMYPYPVISYWPTPFVGIPVTFDGTGSYDYDGWITLYGWDFGDGQSGAGPVVTHTYSTAGMYYVSLSVTDNLGATSTRTWNITVHEPAQPKLWTFFVYLDADNNLEEVGSIDFTEMSQVGSDANLNIVVEMDRSPYYDYQYGDWTSTKRFYVTPWMSPYGYNALEDLGEKNMGDPQTLSDFLIWGVNAYPANNYALILWDHGGGWDGAVCWDETDNYDALTLDEVEIALSAATNSTGARVNLLGFDACLMGMVEVAYEVIDQVDAIAFSEETVPWDGLPYDTVLWDLRNYPTMSPTELGDVIVSRYIEYYSGSSNYSYVDPYVTMSSMDVLASGAMYQALELFTGELRLAIASEQMQIYDWMYNTEYFEYPDYVDLYDFARIVSENTTIDALRNSATNVMFAIDATLTSEAHGVAHPNAHGLSIFFPLTNSTYIEVYQSLDFACAFSWDEFLIEELSAKDDIYEPDNDYLHATPIVHNETQVHTITNGGLDVDWLVFEVLNASEEVRINTSGLPGVDTDTVLWLYDVYGVPYYEIAFDDDNGSYYTSLIQLTLTQGTYYIKAESYDNSIELQWYGISLYIGDIPNIPPMVWIDYWPYDPGVGTVVWFYPYVYDPDGFIESWNWDFGDGTTNTDANYTSHVYTAPGDFTVLLTVVDNNGASASASANVHVTVNLIPIAVLYSYPSLPDPYDTVYFDGSGSYDPDGWIQQYTWDFGDGDSYSTSSNYAYHWYYQGGMYLATLTVMDNRGATNSTSVWVHVNMPPVAVIVPSSETGKVGKPVTFDGSSSYDPEGEVLVYYSWYFSDGGNESGPVVTHTFAAVGQFTVVLQVEDATGAWGYEELAFSVLAPVPPIAVVAYSPANPVVGEQVIFDGSWSIDPDGSIVTYIWQFGDGSIALGAQVVHSYTAAKTYGVRLIVVDEDNLFDKTTSEITVASVPMAGFEFSPSQPIAGQEVTFYAVGSYDPTGIVLYVWSFGDGTYAQGWQVMHTYATTGDKTVSLTVTNAMGVQATITKVVTVASSAMSTEIPTSTSALGAGPEDLAVPGIGLLMATLVSLMVGCVVLDVAGSVGHRRRGA